MKVRYGFYIDKATSQAKLGKYLSGEANAEMEVVVQGAEVLAEKTEGKLYYGETGYEKRFPYRPEMRNTIDSDFDLKFEDAVREAVFKIALEKVLENPDRSYDGQDRFCVQIEGEDVWNAVREKINAIFATIERKRELQAKINALKEKGFRVWATSSDYETVGLSHDVLGSIEGKTEELYEKYALMDEKEFELLVLRKKNEDAEKEIRRLKAKLQECESELEKLLSEEDDD